MRRSITVLALLALPLTAACASSQAVQNKALVQKWIHEYFTEHDLSASSRYLREDYIQHSPGFSSGRAGMDADHGPIFEAVPDMKAEFVHLVAEDDRVAGMIRWTGTVQNRMPGIDADVGIRPFETRTAEVWRVEDGRLAEHWDLIDNCSFLKQLGLLPDMP